MRTTFTLIKRVKKASFLLEVDLLKPAAHEKQSRRLALPPRRERSTYGPSNAASVFLVLQQLPASEQRLLICHILYSPASEERWIVRQMTDRHSAD